MQNSPPFHERLVVGVEDAQSIVPMALQFKVLSEKNMQWIQLKARRKLDELKEEMEWKEYCNINGVFKDYNHVVDIQNLSFQSHKDIGVQVQPKTYKKVLPSRIPSKPDTVSTSRGWFHPSPFSCQRKTILQTPETNVPENLQVIKEQLRNIQLRLSELGKYNSPSVQQIVYSKNEHDVFRVKEVPAASNIHDRPKAFYVKRCLKPDFHLFSKFNENLEKISFPKPKFKETGFVLPYVLKQQRFLARRAYLSSLTKSSKPRQSKRSSFACNTQASSLTYVKKNPTSSQPNRSRYTKKECSSAKNVAKGKTESSALKVEAENMNHNVISVESESVVFEKEEKPICLDTGIVSQEKLHLEDAVFSPSIFSVVIDKSKNQQGGCQIENLNPQDSVGIMTTCLNQSSVQPVPHDIIINGRLKPENMKNENIDENIVAFHQNKPGWSSPSPIYFTHSTNNNHALVLDDSQEDKQELFMTSQSVKRIYNYRERFQKHLTQFLPEGRRCFKPWKLTNEIADAILEDCLQDVQKELYEIPSFVVTDLYNEEFVQSAHS